MRSTSAGGVACVESSRICFVNGRINRVNIARIVHVLDVALAGVVLLVAVDCRTFSRWSGVGACGAGGIRSGARSGG